MTIKVFHFKSIISFLILYQFKFKFYKKKTFKKSNFLSKLIKNNNYNYKNLIQIYNSKYNSRII